MPKAVERGGYLPIPRRDTRAGESGSGDASAELNWPQRPERREERVTERHHGRGNNDEQSAKKSARSGRDQAMRRE